MRHQIALDSMENGFMARLAATGQNLPRRAVIGIILVVSLLAFEVFNFDTTRFALRDLMGDIRFASLEWAAILALAFCSIDFAGLVRLFTPQKGREEPREVWYLMGAWLLGATMNAVMTWWAVSITLLNHDLGNEVLSREQLLDIVPVFVAVLVWLTRILFIGAFTVAGEHLLEFESERKSATRVAEPERPVAFQMPKREQRILAAGADVPHVSSAVPGFLSEFQPSPGRASTQERPMSGQLEKPTTQPVRQGHSRIKQRPPSPGGMRRTPYRNVQARPQGRN